MAVAAPPLAPAPHTRPTVDWALVGAITGTLLGAPISPGTAAGNARVMSHPDDGPVLPGDILVIPVFSAAWMPLLRLAGGVVAEIASVLSEPATQAREARVPVVGGIPGATGLISDGIRLVIDGSHGLVHVTRS
ncbi:MAG TPA: PEP-utilizing enzyme [Chloroflexota bacterium]|nr:PEP-utilizing enzyme [Chloroflexota bacterium]